MAELLAPVFFIVLVVFLLWFALGTQANIRKGNSVLTWLQAGLPLLGPRAGVRWLGSSAVQLEIADAKEPFRSAEVVVVLEPRDLGWLWAWARSRGRKDFVILRGRLRAAPRFELEAGDVGGWTGRDRLKRLDEEAWERAEWDLPGLEVVHSSDADGTAARAAWDELSALTAAVWRLSIRRDNPHVEVHLVLPDRDRVGADRLVEAFLSLGRSAIRTA